jgi:hypothetical protein
MEDNNLGIDYDTLTLPLSLQNAITRIVRREIDSYSVPIQLSYSNTRESPIQSEAAKAIAQDKILTQLNLDMAVLSAVLMRGMSKVTVEDVYEREDSKDQLGRSMGRTQVTNGKKDITKTMHRRTYLME